MKNRNFGHYSDFFVEQTHCLKFVDPSAKMIRAVVENYQKSWKTPVSSSKKDNILARTKRFWVNKIYQKCDAFFPFVRNNWRQFIPLCNDQSVVHLTDTRKFLFVLWTTFSTIHHPPTFLNDFLSKEWLSKTVILWKKWTA